MSTESEIFMRKPSSTFFWRRGSRMSDATMLAGGDEIEPVPVSALLRTPTIPVTLITPASTPTVVQMPVLEVRRPSDSTVNSADAPRERRSIRLSLRGDEVLNLGGGLRHDMSARRHMSLALTERDSDDDTCYFGVAEEDVEAECSTPLSPPPKGQQFTDSP
ncbi:uncharacterized protein CTRU02_204244 [Colletotrichum truncatum]|uniref:Uncharacterized protein n=1 Tax=Colletotrichum truncatum TaxID=5467 RepID=A0ACC3ZBJ8_COLTU